MTPFLWQAFGVVLLLAGLFLGDLLLQRREALTGAARQTRTLVLMASLGGLIGGPAWWQNLPWAFAWDLPPLAARYLAVAALCFAFIGLRALASGAVTQMRVVSAMIAVYLGPLTVAIVLFHLDRFNFAAPVTYAFFAIVAVMLAGALLEMIRLPMNERGLSGALLWEVGVPVGLWGLALFAWPAGPVALIWPWPQDPLSSRLIAAMFLTVATACLMAEGPAERRLALWLCLTYGAGIVGVSAWALWTAGTAPLLYLIGWALVAITAAAGLISGDGSGRAPSASPRD